MELDESALRARLTTLGAVVQTIVTMQSADAETVAKFTRFAIQAAQQVLEIVEPGAKLEDQ